MSGWFDPFSPAWQRRRERFDEQFRWRQRSASERAAIIRTLTLYWLLAPLTLFATIWLLKWLFTS